MAKPVGTVTLLLHRLQQDGVVVTAECASFVQPSAQQNGSAARTTAIIVSTIAPTILCTSTRVYANQRATVAGFLFMLYPYFTTSSAALVGVGLALGGSLFLNRQSSRHRFTIVE